MTEEKWKDIIGYENLYQISNKGHISKCCLGKRKTHKKHTWRYAAN